MHRFFGRQDDAVTIKYGYDTVTVKRRPQLYFNLIIATKTD